ncbi:hypothetical protein SAMN05443667_101671 [Flavobacterium gillisiae]|uniref:Carboxypeptidase-like regulatory domain-containing protein n=1 Tax=Flavobacterium gillisiae TaxID=150146 RepID=A0A1H3XUF0_9FLAO|nr:hypothetical protein [Flavobacterium gillisiae]SEA03069.1 hypothetical protein SAMN05443667_101671 [Flavobacterium gillisiae]
MKKKYFLLLFSFSIICSAQDTKIEGIVSFAKKGNNYVSVQVNDTLKKFRDKAKLTKKWDSYPELTKNKRYVTHTDSTGFFSISAKPTDSLFFSSLTYVTQKFAVSDLIKSKEINILLEPEPCIPYVECKQEKPSKFYIFIGKKIDIKYEKGPNYCDVIFLHGFNGEFKSEYKIEKNIYGNYQKDTINFAAIDEYGIPNFSKYENVLLFVGEYCGQLYHLKYQYFDLYKVKNGKWASPGNPYKYDKNVKEKIIQARKIKFDDSVWFDITKLTPNQIETEYPSEYYKITNNKAIPIRGTYVDDLVIIKKNGVLKARNIELE